MVLHLPYLFKEVCMKRLSLSLVLVFILAGFVFANGAVEDQVTLTAEEEMWSSELHDWSGKTIRVMMIGDPWIDSLIEISKNFERITGAKVIVDGYGYDQTHEKEVLEGNQPNSDVDIIVLDAPWVGEFAEAGYVENLKPYIEKEDSDLIAWNDYFSTFRDVVTWKDQIVGLPFASYYVMGNYRKDILDKEGFDFPVTTDDVKAIAKHFSNNPDYPNMYGVAMNNQSGSAVGQAFFEWIYSFGGKPFMSMYPGSPDSYADMTPNFDSPEAKETVQFFIDLLEYQPEGALSIAWDDRAKYFASGYVAQAFMWSARMAMLEDPNKSAVIDKVDFGLFPSSEPGKSAPPLGGWLMGIASNGNQKDMAWDFIKWFCSQDVHQEFVMAGGPPSRYSIFTDPETTAKYSWLDTLEDTVDRSYADCRPRIPESNEIITTVGTYISRAMTGELTVDKAMKALNVELAEMLSNAGYNVSK